MKVAFDVEELAKSFGFTREMTEDLRQMLKSAEKIKPTADVIEEARRRLIEARKRKMPIVSFGVSDMPKEVEDAVKKMQAKENK